VKVDLPRTEVAKMTRALRRAGRREIGGILMGEQIAERHFRVVDFSIDEVTGSYAHFVRSPEHHVTALAEFFERTGKEYARYNYLGEWHSHPSFPVRPSHEDALSMDDLVHGERDISFAVLLIVKRAWWCFECSATMFVRGEQPINVEARIVK